MTTLKCGGTNVKSLDEEAKILLQEKGLQWTINYYQILNISNHCCTEIKNHHPLPLDSLFSYDSAYLEVSYSSLYLFYPTWVFQLLSSFLRFD